MRFNLKRNKRVQKTYFFNKRIVDINETLNIYAEKIKMTILKVQVCVCNATVKTRATLSSLHKDCSLLRQDIVFY